SGLIDHEVASCGLGVRSWSYSSRPSSTFELAVTQVPPVLAKDTRVGGSGLSTTVSVPLLAPELAMAEPASVSAQAGTPASTVASEAWWRKVRRLVLTMIPLSDRCEAAMRLITIAQGMCGLKRR